jgi:hypothetical protein
LQCREALMYSYVFGYYMFDKEVTDKAVLKGCLNFTPKEKQIVQNLFEDQQEMLENSTEKLAFLLEQPVEKMCFDESVKNDIMNTTVLATKRHAGLLVWSPISNNI